MLWFDFLYRLQPVAELPGANPAMIEALCRDRSFRERIPALRLLCGGGWGLDPGCVESLLPLLLPPTREKSTLLEGLLTPF